jgi:hypothetical protein
MNVGENMRSDQQIFEAICLDCTELLKSAVNCETCPVNRLKIRKRIEFKAKKYRKEIPTHGHI